MLAAIFSGVNLLAISPNGDDLCGSDPPRGDDDDDDADAPGDAHDMGMHLRRLLGRPWLCTGSNSKDLLSVAHAMVLLLTLLTVVARCSRAHCAPSTTDTQSFGPRPRGAREGERDESREGGGKGTRRS